MGGRSYLTNGKGVRLKPAEASCSESPETLVAPYLTKQCCSSQSWQIRTKTLNNTEARHFITSYLMSHENLTSCTRYGPCRQVSLSFAREEGHMLWKEKQNHAQSLEALVVMNLIKTTITVCNMFFCSWSYKSPFTSPWEEVYPEFKGLSKENVLIFTTIAHELD